MRCVEPVPRLLLELLCARLSARDIGGRVGAAADRTTRNRCGQSGVNTLHAPTNTAPAAESVSQQPVAEVAFREPSERKAMEERWSCRGGGSSESQKVEAVT